MSAEQSQGNLLIVTNIPTPYRVHFFEVLGRELGRRDMHLTVLFTAETEPGRKWDVPSQADSYTRVVMRGASLQVSNAYLTFNPTVWHHIRKARPDLVVLGGSWNGPSILLSLLKAKTMRIPILFWSEGHEHAVTHPDGVIANLRRRTFSQADGFVVPNDRSGRFALAHSARDVPVIKLPNTVDDQYFCDRTISTLDAREALGIPNIKTLAMVSSLEGRKRVVESLQAYLDLDPELQSKFQIVVAGDGPLRDEVAALASSSPGITWLGHRSQAEIRMIYRAANVYWQASYYDPNPLSMIEAAFSGCALMATESVGNVDELIPQDSPYRIDDTAGAFETNLKAALTHFALASETELVDLANDAWGRAREGFASEPVAVKFVDDLLAQFPLRRYDPQMEARTNRRKEP